LVGWLIEYLVSSLFGWFVLSCLFGWLVGTSIYWFLPSSFLPFFLLLSGFVSGWFLACLLHYLASQKVSQDAGYKTNNFIKFIFYKRMNILHAQA